MPPRLAIFDDDAGHWGPLADRRAACDFRTGAVTSRRRIERALQQTTDALLVPERLAQVTAERHRDTSVNPDFTQNSDAHWLLVSARWGAHNTDEASRLAALPPNTALLQNDGQLVAAHLPAQSASFTNLPRDAATQTLEHNTLLTRPWHILDQLDDALRADLDATDLPDALNDLPPGAHLVGEHAVHIATSATVMPGVVINTTQGPVCIDQHAHIQPFTAIDGPCYIGAHTELAAHTAIRAKTVIGPQCKVGGEVKASVIQGCSNKAHLGYLGDALVGEWVNLGADTNVSNLKNTYGPVRVQLEPCANAEHTNRTNHGPIIGDFVRTAIGSRLPTGSVIGTGAMLAISHFAPKHTPRFTFATDAGAQTHDLDALLRTAAHMTQRRGVTLTDADTDLLRTLHTRATTTPA